MSDLKLNTIFSNYTYSGATDLNGNSKDIQKEDLKTIEFKENFSSFISRAFSELFSYIASRGKQVPEKGFFHRDIVHYDVKAFKKKISEIENKLDNLNKEGELSENNEIEGKMAKKEKYENLLKSFRKVIPSDFHKVILGKDFQSRENDSVTDNTDSTSNVHAEVDQEDFDSPTPGTYAEKTLRKGPIPQHLIGAREFYSDESVKWRYGIAVENGALKLVPRSEQADFPPDRKESGLVDPKYDNLFLGNSCYAQKGPGFNYTDEFVSFPTPGIDIRSADVIFYEDRLVFYAHADKTLLDVSLALADKYTIINERSEFQIDYLAVFWYDVPEGRDVMVPGGVIPAHVASKIKEKMANRLEPSSVISNIETFLGITKITWNKE